MTRRLPLYYEVKVAFVVYLWHPRFKGALGLYERSVQPLLKAHEATIDRTVEEWRAKGTDALSSQLRRLKAWVQSSSGPVMEQMRQMMRSKGPGGSSPPQGSNRRAQKVE